MSKELTLDLKSLEENKNISARDYWKKRLLNFEFDTYFHPDNKNYRSSGQCDFKEHEQGVPEEVNEYLSKVASTDLAKHILLLSTLGILIQKYSGLQDIGIFTPTYRNNNISDVDEALALVRLNNFSEKTFPEFLNALKGDLTQDFRFANYSIKKNERKRWKAIQALPIVAILVEEIQQQSALPSVSPDILFTFSVRNKLTLKIKYNSAEFSIGFIDQISRHYLNLLPNLIKNKDKRIADVDILTEADKHQLLHQHAKASINRIYKNLASLIYTSGIPMDNLSLYIVDIENRLVPNGVFGELCIGGVELGSEYLNGEGFQTVYLTDNLLKAEQKIYKTGDLGRRLPDGNIELLGKIIDNVKIRGININLSRIENCITDYDSIMESLVTVREKSGNKSLVAYYTSLKEIEPIVIRDYLLERLPDYMVPDHFTLLKNLPTFTSQSNKRALSDLKIGFAGSSNEIAENLLNKFKAQRSDYSPVEKVGQKNHYKLSSAQKRLYILYEFDKSSVAYNMPQAIRLEGHLDSNRLVKAFEKLIARHESLRTSFEVVAEGPVQRIASKVEFHLDQFESTEEEAQFIIDKLIRPFDLSSAPLIRGALIKFSEEVHLLIIDLHHIISDGISVGILIRELTVLYGDGTLPELKLQYRDYSHWQQQEEQQKQILEQRRFWLNEFNEPITVLDLPADYSRPLVKQHTGGLLKFSTSAGETEALKGICEKEGTTLFMLLFAIYNIFLGKLGNQEDVIIGVPTAGRPRADFDDIIGMFVNTLALRNSPKGELSFQEFLSSVKSRTLNFFDNELYPYEELINDLKVERDTSRNALFDVMFSFYYLEPNELTLPRLKAEPLDSGHKIAKFDLLLTIGAGNDELFFNFEYDMELFKEPTIKKFINYFKEIISAVIRDVKVKISDIEIISEKEKHQILSEFNDTSLDYPEFETIVSLFENRVKISPKNIAVVSEGISYSYEWLNATSNQIAKLLQSKGVACNCSVIVIMERRIELIVALFAILKANGMYVPIEPFLPQERIKTIINSLNAEYIVTNSVYNDLANELKSDIISIRNAISIDVESDYLTVNEVTSNSLHKIEIAEYSHSNIENRNSSEDLAYVIFTSGSSGEPKGVSVQHKPVINLIHWVNEKYNVDHRDKLLFVSSISFDLSVYDIFGILAAGGIVRIASRKELEEPQLLANILIEEGITFWDSAPAMLQQIIPLLETRREQTNKKGKLRISFLSGDWIPLVTPVQMKALFPNLRFIALGGATEATVWSNFYEVHSVDPNWDSIPYGKPIQNAKYLILDKARKLCPVGVAGDLYIGGVCLANGYINDKELSCRKFIPSPFDADERLYDTGDMARWFPDGNIEFLGRKDSQVKIRGYRIELREIEGKLSKFEGMGPVLAHVIAKSKYNKFICAYYLHDEQLDEEILRKYLSRYLPDYMVPKYFVHLDELPLTKNGKVDRRLLPMPNLSDLDQIRKPKNATEEKIAQIWAELLRLEKDKIGTTNDFFALGGHSIMAVHLINAIQQRFSITIKLREIFENSTIEKLSQCLKQKTVEDLADIPKSDIKEFYPASPAQERLFYEQLLNRNNTAYNISGVYEIKGDIDTETLTHTFKSLINAHESLRTNFMLLDNGVIQLIKDKVDFEIQMMHEEQYNTVKDAYDNFLQPFDLCNDFLMRCGLFKRKENDDLLFVDIHHIICDGVSLNILMNDFKNVVSGNELIPLDLTYKDYACWLADARSNIASQKQYWSNKLSGELPTLDLPSVKNEAPQDENTMSSKTLEIDGALYQSIKQFTSASNVTDFMFLVSLYYIVLSKMAGNHDAIIVTDVVGRTHPKLNGVVGTFINLLPLRVQVLPEKSFIEFLSDVKECVLSAFENQDFQMDQMISMLNKGGNVHKSIFSIHFAFANYFISTTEVANLEMVPYQIDRKETSQFELKVEVIETNKFNIRFAYNETLFSTETIELMMNYYLNTLTIVLKDDLINIESIELQR